MMRLHQSAAPPAPPTAFRRPLAKRIVARAAREAKRMFGVDSYLKGEDRRVLERIVLPHFVQSDACHAVLWVGCEWYTHGYNQLFEGCKEFSTIDIDPAVRRHGARRHIVDGVQNLEQYIAPRTLDLIVCNGVFGWGLDAKPDVERAFAACHECLRDGGALVVGWDDIPERRPFALSECESLRAFATYVFPPLGTAEYVTDTPYRHTYSFYVKPPGGRSGNVGSAT